MNTTKLDLPDLNFACCWNQIDATRKLLTKGILCILLIYVLTYIFNIYLIYNITVSTKAFPSPSWIGEICNGIFQNTYILRENLLYNHFELFIFSDSLSYNVCPTFLLGLGNFLIVQSMSNSLSSLLFSSDDSKLSRIFWPIRERFQICLFFIFRQKQSENS